MLVAFASRLFRLVPEIFNFFDLMKNLVLVLVLAGVLVGCNASNNTPPVTVDPVDNSAGTQLAGTETPTETADGEVLIGGDAVAPEVTPGEAVSFTVLGGNYYYDVEEIRVKEGDTVTINFRSVDGFHDWVVNEFTAATERVQTDGETSVTFVADKKGEFEYYCSVGSHRANGMVGTLIVE